MKFVVTNNTEKIMLPIDVGDVENIKIPRKVEYGIMIVCMAIILTIIYFAQ